MHLIQWKWRRVNSMSLPDLALLHLNMKVNKNPPQHLRWRVSLSDNAKLCYYETATDALLIPTPGWCNGTRNCQFPRAVTRRWQMNEIHFQLLSFDYILLLMFENRLKLFIRWHLECAWQTRANDKFWLMRFYGIILKTF